jgi:hypothetical protein
MQGLDHGLPACVIVNRFARFHNRTGQCGFGDNHAGPDSVLEFVLIHRPICVLGQINQQIERAGFNIDSLAAFLQFSSGSVERKFPKFKISIIFSMFW